MTEEELEKEAGEYAKPFYNMTRYDYVEERTHVKEAYLAGAEPREKRIAELKSQNEKLETRCNELFFQVNEQIAQIEKMKVCSSCANSNKWGECDYNSNICYNCDEKSEWQLKE